MKNFRIFLCGDVMLGRGIDQILPHPSQPRLYESYITDARDYVLLAEQMNGKINYPVSMNYNWGDALTIWNQFKPDLKIINLETTITQSNAYLADKGINYRMHPANIDVLTSAGINICTLSNNHILDWNDVGLKETIITLNKAGLEFCGAGENIEQAMKPAVFNFGLHKRVLVFSAGMSSSGVPSNWQATSQIPGVYYLPDFSSKVVKSVAEHVKQYRQANDLIIFSLHWGSNWGYHVSADFRHFAHDLIDIANVDMIFGHSSHHPRPIEIYRGKPIFYGCGDFINDYEGISGYEEYRGDLTLMYFLDFDVTTLKFNNLTLVPLQIKKFKLNIPNQEDCDWILKKLNHVSLLNSPLILQDQQFIYINK